MTREEALKKLTAVFQDVFDYEKIMVTEQTSADDIKEWDSLMHITLISAVEDEFKVKFSMQEIMEMKNAGEMAGLIIQKVNM